MASKPKKNPRRQSHLATLEDMASTMQTAFLGLLDCIVASKQQHYYKGLY